MGTNTWVVDHRETPKGTRLEAVAHA